MLTYAKVVCVCRNIQSGCHFYVSGCSATEQISPEVLTADGAHTRSCGEQNVWK